MTNLPQITGHMHATEHGSDRITPPGAPHTYVGMARHHLNGVRVLAGAGPITSLSLAVIAGLVAECALKAYLSRDGDDSRLVKNPSLRHDLSALRNEALKDGLPMHVNAPDWFANLSDLHKKPYRSRYSPDVHIITTAPPAEPMTTELAELVELVAANL